MQPQEMTWTEQGLAVSLRFGSDPANREHFPAARDARRFTQAYNAEPWSAWGDDPFADKERTVLAALCAGWVAALAPLPAGCVQGKDVVEVEDRAALAKAVEGWDPRHIVFVWREVEMVYRACVMIPKR